MAILSSLSGTHVADHALVYHCLLALHIAIGRELTVSPSSRSANDGEQTAWPESHYQSAEQLRWMRIANAGVSPSFGLICESDGQTELQASVQR